MASVDITIHMPNGLDNEVARKVVDMIRSKAHRATPGMIRKAEQAVKAVKVEAMAQYMVEAASVPKEFWNGTFRISLHDGEVTRAEWTDDRNRI